MKKFLTGYIENHRDRVWAGRRRVMKEVWMGIISPFPDLDEGYKYRLAMLNLGCRFILRGKD